MQQRAERTAGCDSAGRDERAVHAGACCGGVAEDTSFAQRADLGRARRVLVRRAVLACPAALAVAALTLAVTRVSPVLGGRLAWGAAIWAAGPVLGWVRAAIAGHRLEWRLVVPIAAVAAGLAWQPLVAALAAVALLAERLIHPPEAVPERTGHVTGGVPPTAGQPG
jgi:hypothetical protein